MYSRGQGAEDKYLLVQGGGIFTKEDELRIEWHISTRNLAEE